MTLTLVLKEGFYLKYKSSISYHSKAMSNVKVIANNQTEGQTDKLTG